MPAPSEQDLPVRMILRRPPALPGVAVLRLSSTRHLFRAVPEKFSTVLHLAGRSEWTMRNARWTSGPGSVGVKIPGEVYAERSRDGAVEFQVVVFDDAIVEEARAALERSQIVPEAAIDARDPRVQALGALHRRLLAGDATSSALEQTLCDALSAFVELTGASRGPRFTRSAWSPAVARARAMLDARLDETVGLDELAVHARLDKFRLSRAFRAEVGLPPHAYVTLRRVGMAQGLLASGVSQSEVAMKVGLYDQSQLHRHFKRIVGVTPGAYARAARAPTKRTRSDGLDATNQRAASPV